MKVPKCNPSRLVSMETILLRNYARYWKNYTWLLKKTCNYVKQQPKGPSLIGSKLDMIWTWF